MLFWLGWRSGETESASVLPKSKLKLPDYLDMLS